MSIANLLLHSADRINRRFIPTCVGLRVLLVLVSFLHRFTPTHVGSTRSSLEIGIFRSVHPHARGVYSVLFCCGERQCGSSPQTWGIFGCHNVPLYGQRFIPTVVGLRILIVLVSFLHRFTPTQNVTTAAAGVSRPRLSTTTRRRAGRILRLMGIPSLLSS